MKKVMTERIVLDPEEREIRKSWGDDWKKIMADMRKFKRACLLIGMWQKNGSVERKMYHAEYVKNEHSRGTVLHSIVFPDGTLNVDIRAFSLEQIFEWKVRRDLRYMDLINAARESLEPVYHYNNWESWTMTAPASEQIAADEVTEGNEIRKADAEPEPVNYKDKIRREQEGNNWYDRM